MVRASWLLLSAWLCCCASPPTPPDAAQPLSAHDCGVPNPNASFERHAGIVYPDADLTCQPQGHSFGQARIFARIAPYEGHAGTLFSVVNAYFEGRFFEPPPFLCAPVPIPGTTCFRANGCVPNPAAPAGVRHSDACAGAVYYEQNNGFWLPLGPSSGSLNYASRLILPGAVWGDGVSMRFVGGGGDVPPFQIRLDFPCTINLTAPAGLVASDRIQVQRSEGITVQWQGRGTAKVQLSLSDNSPSGGTILCEFPATAGTGTIPSALLSTASNFILIATTTQTVNTRLGNWDFVVEGSRHLAGAYVTVQSP